VKLAVTTLATVTLLACSQENAQRLPIAPGPPVPTAAPTPTPNAVTALVVMVVDETGLCIVDATIQVVRGQRSGQSVTQPTPCDAWDYGGGVVFKDLTPGVEMTLRATAAGFVPQEKTVIPAIGPQTPVLLAPTRIR
jgi:hypothetical protein